MLALSAVIALAAAGTARADDARDYIADAKLFYRIVACGGSDPVPAGFDADLVTRHCGWVAKRYAEYEHDYVKPASEFFAKLRPATLPTTVVYPFGGGDLGSALITFPDAREITTISLEHTKIGRAHV